MLAFQRLLIYFTASLLVSAFVGYINIAYLLDNYWQWFDNNDHLLTEYDYIVVGAGSAGAVLSARLADYGYKTLLIEAGGSAPPFLDIPLLAPAIQKSAYDWQYTTVPQEYSCKGLINNQSRWPMGKILGGTSRLNYMVYVRGHPLDYEKWFPDFIDPIIEKGGPMHTHDLKWNTDFPDVILSALRELGQPVGDINEDLDIGFMKVKMSLKDGKRWSTDRLLQKNFKNTLTVLTHAQVDKVLMESDKAVGVQFIKLNRRLKAMSKEGVILSAGAIGTPKILMLSGIGPKEHLESLNINVVHDLPVGQNLVDHVLTGIDLVTVNMSFSLSMINALNPKSALDYFLYGEGPWTSPAIEVTGTFRSSLQKNKTDVPDLQLMIFPLGLSTDNGIVLKEAIGFSDEIFNKYFAPLVHKNAVTIAPVLLHPKSTGEVKLRSNDPFDEPLIDPKYLSSAEDVAALVDGLQFVKLLVETNSMRTLNASIYETKFPGCDNEEFGSTEYWECYIRHLTLTAYHPAGTCRMGDVVDDSFRVRGMKNLYVIDASILPTLPSGNINAAVIMLAEKAARMFKQKNENAHRKRFRCYKLQYICDVFNVCWRREKSKSFIY